MKNIWIYLLICMVFPAMSKAQKSEKLKPRWISVTPQPANPTYDFVVIRAIGDSPEAASQACMDKLVNNEDLRTSVQAIVNRHKNSEQIQHFDNGRLTEHITNKVVTDVVVNGKQVSITASPIDEYWSYTFLNGHRVCECYTLYMLAVTSLPPVYDNVSFTNYYGARGLVRSIIPGWGQIYKGSTAKGICILGGEMACVAGIIVSENMRASYVKKMKEQPKHAATYNSKADNWENGRNICIGATAALYIYNLVDAITAKGAKRVVVKPRREINFSIVPAVVGDGVGVGFAFNF